MENETKRQLVTYRYDALNHDFIKCMAEIAFYAQEKYGSPEQYKHTRLEGEKGPINHIYEHLRAYQAGDEHDHFGGMRHQLAAVAYNAMMEFLYAEKFGFKGSPLYDVDEAIEPYTGEEVSLDTEDSEGITDEQLAIRWPDEDFDSKYWNDQANTVTALPEPSLVDKGLALFGIIRNKT